MMIKIFADDAWRSAALSWFIIGAMVCVFIAVFLITGIIFLVKSSAKKSKKTFYLALFSLFLGILPVIIYASYFAIKGVEHKKSRAKDNQVKEQIFNQYDFDVYSPSSSDHRFNGYSIDRASIDFSYDSDDIVETNKNSQNDITVGIKQKRFIEVAKSASGNPIYKTTQVPDLGHIYGEYVFYTEIGDTLVVFGGIFDDTNNQLEIIKSAINSLQKTDFQGLIDSGRYSPSL